MQRRQFVGLVATTGTLSVAGCLGGGDGKSGEASATAAAEAYFSAGGADEAEKILHPDSPLTPQEQEEQRGENTEVEFIEASIIAADTDAAGIDEAGYNPDRMEDAELDSLAESAEVTLLEATVEINGEEWPFATITATDGGNWYVLTTATQDHTQ